MQAFLSGRSYLTPVNALLVLAATLALPAGAVALMAGFRPALWDVVCWVVFHLLTLIGISLGLHRFFSHRTFQATPLLRGILVVLGSLPAQGNVLMWAGTHRRHHRFADTPEDPHSIASSPFQSRMMGVLHSYALWFFDCEARPVALPDLEQDRLVIALNRAYPLWVALGLVIPALVGFLFGGTLAAALSGFFWGGLLRLALTLHMTLAVNAFQHLSGARVFDTPDKTGNSGFLWGLLTGGEAFHNNHHAFAASARLGLTRMQPDAIYWLLRGLEKVGLAHSIREVSPSLIAARRAGAAGLPVDDSFRLPNSDRLS